MTNSLTTKSAADLIDTLNKIRTENGKKTIKGTGTSKQALIVMIQKEEKLKKERIEKENEKLIVESDEADRDQEKCTIEVDVKENDEGELEVETITAVEIADILGKDPKTLRRKLRKIVDDLPERLESGKWTFRIEFKDELIKKLK